MVQTGALFLGTGLIKIISEKIVYTVTSICTHFLFLLTKEEIFFSVAVAEVVETNKDVYPFYHAVPNNNSKMVGLASFAFVFFILELSL